MTKASGLSKSLSSGKKKSSKKKSSKHKAPKHMHISDADNGGFNVHHFDEDPSMGGEPDSTHALSDPSQLLGHVQDQYGGQMPEGGGGPAAPAGPAAAPAGPAPGGM